MRNDGVRFVRVKHCFQCLRPVSEGLSDHVDRQQVEGGESKQLDKRNELAIL